MINHLKTKNHEDALKLFESENAEMTPKLTSVWAQKNAEADLQNKLDEQLVRIMVRQNVSTCFFDDQDLQELVKLAYPGQQIFSRMHFTRSVIPCMAGEIRTNIVKQIGSNKFSITSDGWMKPSKFPALLSVTTHTISADFQRMDNVIATIEILSEHTGEEIARLIENFLVENGLSIGSIVACDVCTRWNSTFLMINSFLEMKNALLKTDDYLREISDLQRRPTNFSQNEWNNLKRLAENLEPLSREDFVIIGELCKVLKVFHVETCRLSQEQSTASAYIPTAKKILLFLRERRCRNADVQMISENLAQNLQKKTVSVQQQLPKQELQNLMIRSLLRLNSIFSGMELFDWGEMKMFLNVPATSVSSERTFSMAALLYANTLRNRLGAKMAENLMLIKASLKKTMLAPSVEPDDDELDNKEEIEENVLLQQQID
uniref:HAT C-terminal dimerisation domain-containing protein n=1 Tax=Globodera rostochiensis TaxID=31243 RepID=A0A914HFT3_GLORO